MTTHEAVKCKPMKMNSVLPPPPSMYSMALISQAVESQTKILKNSVTSSCAQKVSFIPSMETITSNFMTDIKASANKFEQTDLYADLSYYNDKELEGNDELSMANKVRKQMSQKMTTMIRSRREMMNCQWTNKVKKQMSQKMIIEGWRN